MGKGLDSNGLKVGKTVVKSFNSTVLNESTGVSDDTTSCTADVIIDLEYFFHAFRNDESRVESSFNC